MPLISVIVPCYNQGTYLGEALESVLNQTYKNWECVIVNDGSTDDTEKVAGEWVVRDDRFKYFKTINSGLAASRNYGINKAVGKYILPLDSDDKIHAEYLKDAIDAFESDPELKLVYCKLAYFGIENNHILPPYNYKDLLVQSMLFCSTVMKKVDIIKVGGYDKNMIYGFEDWEFYINFLDDNAKVYRIDKVLFYYRLKKSSMFEELKKSVEKQRVAYAYMATKHHDIYISHFGSIIENLQLLMQLKEENSLLKSSLFNRVLYAGKKIWKKLI